MTLLITEISKHGIVMGADTAVTSQMSSPSGKSVTRILTGFNKLFRIDYLQAGISCWGYGQIGAFGTDVWLEDFIWRYRKRVGTLQDFAKALAKELNMIIQPATSGKAECGFHLAGFVPVDGKTADFWHIHNGPSQFFPGINPQIFNANHDLVGAISQGTYSASKNNFIIRNGDYLFYAAWWQSFEGLLNTTLRKSGISIPQPSLTGRADYIRFQIRTISEVYRLATLYQTIGGEISILTIDSSGIKSFDKKA